MANYITTLKDEDKTNNLLPRTVLEAVADDNGNYLDSGLAASDINKLKGGEVAKLEENLARIETSPTTHAYSVGERLVYNGILYRVKAAISVGADLVVNTNIEKKSVDDALSDISTHYNSETNKLAITTTANPYNHTITQSGWYLIWHEFAGTPGAAYDLFIAVNNIKVAITRTNILYGKLTAFLFLNVGDVVSFSTESGVSTNRTCRLNKIS